MAHIQNIPFLKKGLLAAVFSLASNAAVLFVLLFGLFLWPERLPANSQNIFWLASGVNVAGLLIFGLRYWPVILLDAIPAWLIVGEALDFSILGSAANALEALLAAWLIRRVGEFDGRNVRAVGALLVASLVAPLVNTLIIPAWLCMKGILAWEEYGRAVTNWNLSNGAAMLILVPLIFAIQRGGWTFRERPREAAGFAVAVVAVCSMAFNAVFEGAGFNFAFVVFPLVIYAAIRFGIPEMTIVLAVMLTAIYGSLVVHSHAVSVEQMLAAIWFVQAFCWVVAATGLIVTALVAAWRQAETAAHDERERALEISLREERARLDALRYQLDPHFLFNSLNSIYSTLPMQDADVPRRMITQLSGYLRSTLTLHKRDMHPLHEELRSMEQYLAIERNRFGDDLCAEVAADGDVLDTPVPVFLLQPLVENAIVHGFATSAGVFQIKIRATLRDATLALEVANTGIWKPAREEGGIGIANTRRRLELLFGSRASLDVENTDGWVRVKINMPHEAV